MIPYAVVRETVTRKRTILVAHLILFCLYVAAPVVCVPVCAVAYAMIGVLLPLVLTNGLWGNDLSSGRVRVLAVTPAGVVRIHIWRLVGMVLQGMLQLVLATLVELAAQRVGGRTGPQEAYTLWIICAFMLFISMTAFSSTISVVVRGEHNGPLIVLLLVVTIFGQEYLARADSSVTTDILRRVFDIISFTFPPVMLLMRKAVAATSFAAIASGCMLALGQGVLYFLAGLFLLHFQEYRPQGSGELS